MVLRGLSPDRFFFPFCRWTACLPWVLVISCLSLKCSNFIRVYLGASSYLLAFSGTQWASDIDIRAFLHFLPVYWLSCSTICPYIGSLFSILHIYLSFDCFWSPCLSSCCVIFSSGLNLPFHWFCFLWYWFWAPMLAMWLSLLLQFSFFFPLYPS